MYCDMGWDPEGQQTDRVDRTLEGTRYTAIVAVSLDGCLALQVMEGGPWQVDFEEFLRVQLVSQLHWVICFKELIIIGQTDANDERMATQKLSPHHGQLPGTHGC